METISPLIPSTRVDSSTSQRSGQNSYEQMPGKGQIMKGTVLEKQPGKLFLLELGNQKIQAQTEANLSVGQTLQLQVIKTAPQYELKIVSNTLNTVLGRSLTLIGKSLDIAPLLQSIKTEIADQFNNLSPATKQTINQFHELQQSRVFKEQPPVRFTSLITRITSTIEDVLSNRRGAALHHEIRNSLADIAALFKGVSDIKQSDMANNTTLSPGQKQLLNLAAQMNTFSKADSKNIPSSILTEFASLLGLDVKKLNSPVQAKPVIAQMTANLFSLIQVIKPALPAGSPLHNISSYTTGNSPLIDKQGGVILKNIIHSLGLKLEALVAKGETEAASKTLKAALMEISLQFQQSRHISETTTRVLTTLELFQMAQLHLNNERQIIVPLPLPFLEQGYLVVNREHREQRNNSAPPASTQFSLYLTLKELGNIRVDFLKNEQGTLIRFNMGSRETSDFIQQHQELLKNSLTSENILGISFSDTAKDPAAELIKKLLPEGKRMLNTRA